MEILKYCKVQIALLIILLFISYLFIKDGNRLKRTTKTNHCNKHFDYLFILGEAALFLDGVTSYTVNHLDEIPSVLNHTAHLLFLLSYQLFIFEHFLYWLSVTDKVPRKKRFKICCFLPIVLSGILTVVFIPEINYQIGQYTNYAQGISAVISYSAIVLYSILTFTVFILNRNYIQRNKRTAFIMALSAVGIITVVQMIFNETLVSCIAVILVVLSIYLCLENPSLKFLEYYHDEMVTGFATLVENKDGSTGSHIRRSSAYAVLITQELRKNPKYRSIITKDYILNIKKAAPMHDIGKIGISDSILQKPGKLTSEEFELMKKHPEIGDKIIRETFGHLDDKKYESIASQVALGHHEKWDGKGYPYHLNGSNIPLCARIMAVADVFDAISADRCYRKAIPLDECYKIISTGRGSDFDPDVVDAFFRGQKQVEAIYKSI